MTVPCLLIFMVSSSDLPPSSTLIVNVPALFAFRVTALPVATVLSSTSILLSAFFSYATKSEPLVIVHFALTASPLFASGVTFTERLSFPLLFIWPSSMSALSSV